MCGIAGFLRTGAPLDAPEAVARRMAQALQHRGPDDEGIWTDASAGVALAHRRLSIIDLSAAGHQPMASASSRYVIAYNGEIYNHQELRDALVAAGAAPAWRGHSDTETLLAGIEAWGLDATLQRAAGMFAIALWDRHERVLWLARDRFGEKPLYYGWCGGSFAFGSELKALRAHPGFANPVCRQALAEYLRFMYVPAPRSMYQGIYKLEPGCVLRVQGTPPPTAPAQPLRPPANYESLSVQRWWSLADVVEQGAQSPFADPAEAKQRLDEGLRRAVRLQSLADVPLGAFLSGGVDSSLITALMQQQSSTPVKTFTVGFEEAGFDESPHARAVARHLGTEHTEMLVTASEVRAVIPLLPTMYDEPFADSSQLPTHLVCRAARQHVTVALSGDAGDELFGGYNRYFWGPRIWARVRHLPHPLRQGLARGLTAISPDRWERAGAALNRLMHGSAGIARFGEKAHKLGSRLQDARTLDEFYLRLVSEWQDPARLVAGLHDGLAGTPSLMTDELPAVGTEDPRARMMFRDSLTYLPDDILCKVDRAAMATSLETRVPFLDKDVVELAWRLPVSMKIRGHEGKSLLRQILYDYVPRELIERPKTGFGIPVGQWLRGPLREWAETLLDERRLRQEGYLDSVIVRETWSQHLSGHDCTAKLWSVLMFQSWLETAS
jgi:asparagine synthase (glutamine-hydrolysing)